MKIIESQFLLFLSQITQKTKNDDIKHNKRATSKTSKNSDLLRETLVSLMKSHKSLGTYQDDTGRATYVRVPINKLGGDKVSVSKIFYT